MLYQLVRSYYYFIFGVALYAIGINFLIGEKDMFSSDDALLSYLLIIIFIALILFIFLLINSIFYKKVSKIIESPYKSFSVAFCTLLFQKISYFILYKIWGYEKAPPYFVNDGLPGEFIDASVSFTITKYIIYLLIFEGLIFLLSKDWHGKILSRKKKG